MINIIKNNCKQYNIDWKFIKFLFVGGINTLFGYSIYSFFLFIGFNYSIALFLGTILAILFNFKTTGLIVFKSHNNKLIYRFFGVYIITYLLNALFLKVFDLLKYNMYLAGLILLLPMAIISFILMKTFVFKERQQNE